MKTAVPTVDIRLLFVGAMFSCIFLSLPQIFFNKGRFNSSQFLFRQYFQQIHIISSVLLISCSLQNPVSQKTVQISFKFHITSHRYLQVLLPYNLRKCLISCSRICRKYLICNIRWSSRVFSPIPSFISLDKEGNMLMGDIHRFDKATCSAQSVLRLYTR